MVAVWRMHCGSRGGSSGTEEEAGAVTQVGTNGGSRDGKKRMELKRT